MVEIQGGGVSANLENLCRRPQRLSWDVRLPTFRLVEVCCLCTFLRHSPNTYEDVKSHTEVSNKWLFRRLRLLMITGLPAFLFLLQHSNSCYH